jgi:PAS domain S-box-containing protein
VQGVLSAFAGGVAVTDNDTIGIDASSLIGKLRLENERLAAIVESVSDHVTIIDKEHRITWANETAAALFGDRVVGKKCWDLYASETEPCQPCPVVECFADGEAHVREREVVGARGERRILRTVASVAARGDAGEVSLVLRLSRDVTEQRKSERALHAIEERFRAIFRGSSDCIFIKDLDLRYTHVNPAMVRLMLLRESDLVGLSEEDVFRDEAAKSFSRELDRAVLQGDTVHAEYARIVNGVPLTFDEIRMPLRGDSGSIVGICGMARKVTAKGRLRTSDRPIRGRRVKSLAIRRVLDQALLAASTDSMVLLTGESGTGKDRLARFIHDHSKRAEGPFFTVNCAAVSKEVAESEFFGYESGAFTGAGRRKKGLLELAEEGTLLLNEIGDLDLRLQAKLLSFLDSKTFNRMGGEREISVNARLMAATNRDISAAMAEGLFREDLFYRINVLTIDLPPLRERIEDLPYLIEEILVEIADELQLEQIPSVDSATVEALSRFDWPGNVRQLRNALESGLVAAEGKGLDTAALFENLRGRYGSWNFTVTFPEGRSMGDVMGEVERALVSEALRRCGGRKRTAARLLRISRDRLYRLLDHDI